MSKAQIMLQRRAEKFQKALDGARYQFDLVADPNRAWGDKQLAGCYLIEHLDSMRKLASEMHEIVTGKYLKPVAKQK